MIEHPAISRRRGGSGGPSLSIRSTQCRACRAFSMCRLSDLSAAAHTFEAAPRLLPARPVKASPLCNRARLPSRGTFHRLMSCDTCRVRSETRFLRTSLPGSGGFAATGPRAALFHRDDPALLLQAWWSRLMPPFTSIIGLMWALLWARRSLSTSATSFQSTTHEHEPRERCPRPLQGIALQSLPRTMRSSRCPRLPL